MAGLPLENPVTLVAYDLYSLHEEEFPMLQFWLSLSPK